MGGCLGVRKGRRRRVSVSGAARSPGVRAPGESSSVQSIIQVHLSARASPSFEIAPEIAPRGDGVGAPRSVMRSLLCIAVLLHTAAALRTPPVGLNRRAVLGGAAATALALPRPASAGLREDLAAGEAALRSANGIDETTAAFNQLQNLAEDQLTKCYKAGTTTNYQTITNHLSPCHDQAINLGTACPPKCHKAGYPPCWSSPGRPAQHQIQTGPPPSAAGTTSPRRPSPPHPTETEREEAPRGGGPGKKVGPSAQGRQEGALEADLQ